MNICAICTNNIENSNICIFRCKHEFHFECIMTLYNIGQGTYKNKCPICRKIFFKYESDDSESDSEDFIPIIRNNPVRLYGRGRGRSRAIVQRAIVQRVANPIPYPLISFQHLSICQYLSNRYKKYHKLIKITVGFSSVYITIFLFANYLDKYTLNFAKEHIGYGLYSAIIVLLCIFIFNIRFL